MLESISVLIGGDIYPGGRNQRPFVEGDVESLFHDVLPDIQQSDLVIANLECPLIRTPSPIAKSGPHLDVPLECINGLKLAPIHILGLANNHILDHGNLGLRTTLATCKDANIQTVGAGMDIDTAQQLIIIPVEGIRIGVLAVAEHEFSIVSKAYGGANPLDIISMMRCMRQQRSEYDFLIILLHGGNEYYPYPSPRLMETCRFLVEEGASAVICQHSHCAGCYESYRHGHIVYGQGNLLFDLPGSSPGWEDGFLVRLIINRTDKIVNTVMDIIPTTARRVGTGINKMDIDETTRFMKALEYRSTQILNADVVHDEWENFCNDRRHFYMSNILTLPRFLRYLNKNSGIIERIYSKRALLLLENTVRCEAHREVILTILERNRNTWGMS